MIFIDTPAKKWTRVTTGWGKFSVTYGIRVAEGKGKYRCYVAGIPFPVSSGDLPAEVTLNVVGYGEIKVFSTMNTSCTLVPVGP